MDTVADLIERNALYYPNRDAFVYEDRRLTHQQFAARARKLAAGLYELGMRRQDRIAILSMNCLEYFELYGAAEVAGYLAVLINFRLAGPEIAHILEDSLPKVLVFEEQYAAAVDKLRSQLPDIAHYVCIGNPPAWARSFDSIVDTGSPAGLPVRARPEDNVYLYYTSGTTGRPKGVAWTHRKACATARTCAQASEFTGATRVLQITPAFHIGGKGYPMGAAWMGGSVVLQRAFDPVKMLEAIQREKVTFTFMVAAMLQAVLDVRRLKSYDLSSMRSIVSASAPIPLPLLKRGIEVLGPIFSVQYGMTEAGTVAVLPAHEVKPDGTPDEVKRLASVGHAVPEIGFRLLDDAGRECPPGTPGEVVIKSECQLDGYWNNSVASSEAIRDGWFHTGDLGVVDAEGYLFLVDRKKDMIVSGGENVYSREVEEALAQHPGVLEAAVIGVPDPKWVETVKAVVVLKPGVKVNEAELIAHCKTLIASYKAPKSIEFLGELPRLATGKLDKPTLRARWRK